MSSDQPAALTASERHAIAAMSNALIYADDRVSVVAQDWTVGMYSTPISGDQIAKVRAQRRVAEITGGAS
ncbi:MAG: hypothetical protein D3X82_01325 [Candidatus Leucobacter sulfamidivorax]|nr:hypothetical protein [Candidatus Leucobacter sulfamidivorax]